MSKKKPVRIRGHRSTEAAREQARAQRATSAEWANAAKHARLNALYDRAAAALATAFGKVDPATQVIVVSPLRVTLVERAQMSQVLTMAPEKSYWKSSLSSALASLADPPKAGWVYVVVNTDRNDRGLYLNQLPPRPAPSAEGDAESENPAAAT